MGYYTSYDISGNSEEIQEAINQKSGYGRVDEDSIKWYNCEKDMRDVSIAFPNIVLTVSGEGEESGDIWKGYFKNGKGFISKAKLSFEEFDEAKLK